MPFALVGVFFGRLSGAVRWLSRYSRVVNRVAGALLMAVGVLMLTGLLPRIAAWMYRLLPIGVG